MSRSDSENAPAEASPALGEPAKAAPPPLPVIDDAELCADAVVVALGSLFICFGAHHLVLMTAVVPALVVARFALWWRASRGRRARLVPEVLLFALCTVLGGFNDWNTVVGHRVYEYTVPVFFPSVSTIPLWMLLFWGIVLRFMLAVGAWRRLGASALRRDAVRMGTRLVGNAAGRVALLLVVTLITRQAIYRFSLDPILSWLPFVVALALYPLLFGWDRHEGRLVGVTLVVGPLVEILYIQGAGLHRYALGWLGGVPLWILCWWLLAILIWKDLGRRLHARLEALLGGGA